MFLFDRCILPRSAPGRYTVGVIGVHGFAVCNIMQVNVSGDCENIKNVFGPLVAVSMIVSIFLLSSYLHTPRHLELQICP